MSDNNDINKSTEDNKNNTQSFDYKKAMANVSKQADDIKINNIEDEKSNSGVKADEDKTTRLSIKEIKDKISFKLTMHKMRKIQSALFPETKTSKSKNIKSSLFSKMNNIKNLKNIITKKENNKENSKVDNKKVSTEPAILKNSLNEEDSKNAVVIEVNAKDKKYRLYNKNDMENPIKEISMNRMNDNKKSVKNFIKNDEDIKSVLSKVYNHSLLNIILFTKNFDMNIYKLFKEYDKVNGTKKSSSYIQKLVLGKKVDSKDNEIANDTIRYDLRKSNLSKAVNASYRKQSLINKIQGINVEKISRFSKIKNAILSKFKKNKVEVSEKDNVEDNNTKSSILAVPEQTKTVEPTKTAEPAKVEELTKKAESKKVEETDKKKTSKMKIRLACGLLAVSTLFGAGYAINRYNSVHQNKPTTETIDDKSKDTDDTLESTETTQEENTANENANKVTVIGVGTKATLSDERYYEVSNGTGKSGIMSDKDKEVTISRIVALENDKVLENDDSSDATVEQVQERHPNAEIKVHIKNKDSELGWIGYDSIKDKVQKEETETKEVKESADEVKEESNSSIKETKTLTQIFRDRYKFSGVDPVKVLAFENNNLNQKEEEFKNI